MTFSIHRRGRFGRSRSVLWGCVALLLFGGCDATAPASPQPVPAPSPTPSSQQQLRIINEGPAAAGDLTVIFPGSRISYGDVASGTTTAHHPAPGGVYSYAAYRLVVNGVTIEQPVIDWVGESPMKGRAFTYTIDVDPARPRSQTVRLVSVMRDE
jgi:hypothetical protein